MKFCISSVIRSSISFCDYQARKIDGGALFNSDVYVYAFGRYLFENTSKEEIFHLTLFIYSIFKTIPHYSFHKEALLQ